MKDINELRRDAVNKLNELRMYDIQFVNGDYDIDIPDFDKERLVTCLVDTKDKYKNLDRDYDIVYCEEKVNGTVKKIPRVTNGYRKSNINTMVS